MPIDVVAELRLVVVDAGVGVNAAARDQGVDQAAPVRVVQLAVGNVHLRDLAQLRIPEPAHVGIVLVEAPGRHQRARRRPRVGVAEPVDREHVVVNGRTVRGDADRVRSRAERAPKTGRDSRPRRAFVGLVTATRAYTTTNAWPPMTSRSANSVIATATPCRLKRGDLSREVPVGVDPGRRRVGVDAEAVCLAQGVLHVEPSTQTRDDAVPVPDPTDRRRGREGAGDGVVRRDSSHSSTSPASRSSERSAPSALVYPQWRPSRSKQEPPPWKTRSRMPPPDPPRQPRP